VIRRAGDEAEGVYPSLLSSPPLTVEPTVLDRLGDVGGCDTLLVLEIGDRARHAEHAVVAAGRQPEPAHGGGEQTLGLRQEWADPTELTGRQLGVHPGPRFAGPGALVLARRDDAGPDGGRGLGDGVAGEVAVGERGQLNVQIDAVQQRPRQSAEIPSAFRRRTETAVERGTPASARIGSGHELKARGKITEPAGASDVHAAVLERLAQ